MHFQLVAHINPEPSVVKLGVQHAPTVSIRRVMGLKNLMAFLIEREKPCWSATKDRSSGWSG
jgi:hypothetical protein